MIIVVDINRNPKAFIIIKMQIQRRFFMKKTLLGLTTAAILSLTMVAQAAPITLKFSHVVAENTPKGQMATKF